MCALYYNTKQKNFKDAMLKSYCDPTAKENCRRRLLLTALGDTSQEHNDPTVCCDRCSNGSVPYAHLQELVRRSKKRHQRKPNHLQELSDDDIEELKKKLI